MSKLPQWFSERVELHETTTTYECGCNPETMELCLAGSYAEGQITEEEIIEDYGFEEEN